MNKKIKIVTCAGFGGSGSSAITDLLKEFNNVESLGDFEFTLAHELDGISDLEYHLVDNKHRLNCDLAIFRFNMLLERISNGYSVYINNFMKISKMYLSELTDLEWDGYWHNHDLKHSKLENLIFYKIPIRLQKKLLRFKKSEYENVPKFKKNKMFYSSLTEEKFLEITKKYTDLLIKDAIKSNFKKEIGILAMDQLVAPNDLKRYSRYFNELKTVVIDRDPRDLFLLNQLYWREGWIPSHDINKYIIWFKKTRQSVKYERDEDIIYIKFENLIWNYEDEINKIYKFLDISEEHHINRKKYFNPNKSKKNVELWKKEEANIFSDEIKKIENELKEFCYYK